MNRPQMTVIKSKTLAMGQSAKFLTRACGCYLLCLIAIYYYTLIYIFSLGAAGVRSWPVADKTVYF